MWSQYARLPYNTCVFLEDDQNCEDYCGLFVNPLTLLAFLRIAKEMKVKTIIITAAMSTLAKALIKLCKSEGIDTIGIIRKEEDLKTLLELGAKYALNLKSENFEKELKELAAKTEARMALDAISGEMSNKLAIAMPENSVVYTYGVLSGGKPDLSKIQDQLKKENKKIEWFSVSNDKIMNDPEEIKKALEFISNDIKKKDGLFKLNVVKKLKLDDVKTAFEIYKTVASKGKCIFVPNS